MPEPRPQFSKEELFTLFGILTGKAGGARVVAEGSWISVVAEMTRKVGDEIERLGEVIAPEAPASPTPPPNDGGN